MAQNKTNRPAQSMVCIKTASLTGILLLFSSALIADPLEIPEVDDVYPVVPDWRSARILQIGDSHLSFAFKREMARHFQEAGARFRQKRWIGSRTKNWITTGKAKRLIDLFRPTVVVVTLGTNEMKYNPRRQESWVRALVNIIGPRTCFWVGPPPLIDDNHGYNDYMADHVAPCRYFDSRVLDAPKRTDHKFHLSRKQGEAWAALVWRWMNGT